MENTDIVIKKLQRLISIASLIKKKKAYLNDLEQKFRIESFKPHLESFSTVSRSWYLMQMEETKKDLNWLYNRFEQTDVSISEFI